MDLHIPVETNFANFPELVVYKILDKLPKLSDLKSLRLACLTTKSWVDNYSPFYEKFIIKINSANKLCSLLEKERDYRYWTNCQLSSDSIALDFQEFETFQIFLECYSKHVKTLQIVNYPFKSMNLNFLSHFDNLVLLEFSGNWAIACFFKVHSQILKCKLKSIVFRLSCVGLSCSEFQNFGKLLLNFTSLETLKIYCDQNYPLLFRQILFYIAKRFPTFKDTDLNNYSELEDFVRNPESEFFPGVRKVCEFCGEMEFNFSNVKHANENNCIENAFFSSVTGLRTITYGHNVSFPLLKFENIGWISIHMSKFNYPDSFCLENYDRNPREMLFPNLTSLHLSLKNDFELVELQKAQKIFGNDGKNKISKLVLELPNSKLEGKDEIVIEFLSHFKKLKELQFHNWFSPVWTLPSNLEKLELFSINGLTN